MNNIFNNSEIDQIRKVLTEVGFIIEYSVATDARKPESIPVTGLNLSEKGQDFWPYPMWTHQFKAVKAALEGNNVCVSTSTSSGKTEILQTIAIDTLARI